jgi:hypothetical protein
VAVTAKQYANSNRHLTNGDVNFLTDTIKVALLSAYTPNQTTHDTWADVVAAGTEATGSGYTARGQALATKTITTAGLVTTIDAADLVWTTANPGTLAAAFAVFYKDTVRQDDGSWALKGSAIDLVAQLAQHGGPPAQDWRWATHEAAEGAAVTILGGGARFVQTIATTNPG